MKFGFIFSDLLGFYPLKVACRALEVSVSGFLAWRHRPRSRRSVEDERLADRIVASHRASGQAYGSPRVHADLKDTGFNVSRKRVAKIMDDLGIQGAGRQCRPKTTDSNHDNPVADNLIARDFTADAPDRKWVTDITAFPTGEGWLYLSAIEDLFSRKIVG